MMDEQPRMEDAEWLGSRRPRHMLAVSNQLLRAMKVGETKRLYHPDVNCRRTPNGYACTVQQEAQRHRRQGWKLRLYHEKEHVLVVRRDA